MKPKTSPTETALHAARVAGLMAIMSVPVAAAEVTLTAKDGSMSVTGEILDVIDDAYVIESRYGSLRVPVNFADCTGDACPQIQAGPNATVTWDVSLWGKRRAFTEHVERLAELVNEKTDGKFILNLSYGDLSPSRENLDGIAAGTFEMAQFCAGYHPDKTPALSVLELPFLGVSSLEQELALSLAAYQTPTIVAEMAGWNASLLMPSPLPQNNIIGVGFPPTSLDAFNGMKIRTTGGVARAVEALGAVAVPLPAPEVQQALADGEISAVAFAPHAHMAFGTIESGSWWTTNLNPGTSNCPVVVNTTALERLPEPHRTALMSSVDDALSHYIDHYNGATMDAWGPALRARDIIQITIKDTIVEAINKKVAGPAAAAWIAKNTAKGLPAQALYNQVTLMINGGS